MESTKLNGGPAFPTDEEVPAHYNGHNNSKELIRHQGMTLRDYIAVAAMKALVVAWKGDIDFDEVATASQMLADAMLKARSEVEK